MLELLTCSTMTVRPSLTSDLTPTNTPLTALSWVASSDLMASAPWRTPCGPSTQTAASSGAGRDVVHGFVFIWTTFVLVPTSARLARS